MLPERNEEVDEELIEDSEDAGTIYECQRCDEEFIRTDVQVQDEGQSIEYCDDCLRLMSKAESGENDEESEDDEA